MPNSIKICYILPEYSENIAGHFYHHYELLKELSKRLDIFLILEKSDSNDIKLANKVYIQKFRFIPLRMLESFLAILKARFLGYKIFYTHYCYIGGINAAIISKLFGGKSYYWNCAMNWLFRQRTLPGWGYKLSMKLSHCLVTGSREMKKGYIEHYNLKSERIKIMPNWVNLNRFKSAKNQITKSKSRTILFIHWLSKRKGADMIVPIMNNLKLRIKNLKLVVIGEGPYKDKLLEEIKENRLEEFIEILGGIPHKQITDYYSMANIFLMPSMEEGFPRVLLEAMASGIPYVASDVGAVREISPEAAQKFLVKPGDVEMFVNKIETLLSDKKVYDKFRKEELKKVKEYSLEKIIDKFIDIIS